MPRKSAGTADARTGDSARRPAGSPPRATGTRPARPARGRGREPAPSRPARGRTRLQVRAHTRGVSWSRSSAGQSRAHGRAPRPGSRPATSSLRSPGRRAGAAPRGAVGEGRRRGGGAARPPPTALTWSGILGPPRVVAHAPPTRQRPAGRPRTPSPARRLEPAPADQAAASGGSAPVKERAGRLPVPGGRSPGGSRRADEPRPLICIPPAHFGPDRPSGAARPPHLHTAPPASSAYLSGESGVPSRRGRDAQLTDCAPPGRAPGTAVAEGPAGKTPLREAEAKGHLKGKTLRVVTSVKNKKA